MSKASQPELTITGLSIYPVKSMRGISLAAVNTALAEKGEQAIPMDRFRPNIVVKGLPAFE